MVRKQKTILLGTTRKIPTQDEVKRLPTPDGCLYTFKYRAKDANDPEPFIIMTSPRWIAKNGNTYISGVNLKTMSSSSRSTIIDEFGSLPVGSVSYSDIQAAVKEDPECCIRTYNVRNVRALHKVEA
jgi:hypothetical protein